MSPQQPTGYRIRRLDLDAAPEASMRYLDQEAAPGEEWREVAEEATTFPDRDAAFAVADKLNAAAAGPHQWCTVVPLVEARPTEEHDEAEIKAIVRGHRHVEPDVTFEQLEKRGLA